MGVVTDRERWNRRYSRRRSGSTSDAGPPSQWLLAQGDILDPQRGDRALDVACGLGSNALHLGELGYDVDAVDVSDVAVAALDAAARRHRLPVRARRVDLLDPEALERDAYAVVVVFSFLERAIFAALSAALRPSGLLVYETFTTGQLALDWGPSDERRVLRPGELERAFPGLEVLRAHDSRRSREGAHLAGIVARRPTSRHPAHAPLATAAGCPDPAPAPVVSDA